MSQQFNLLSQHYPRQLETEVIPNPPTTFSKLLLSLNRFRDDPILALDYETQGLDFSDPALEPVGIGLSNGHDCLYVPILGMPSEVLGQFYGWLDKKKLVAHNIPFDGGWYLRQAGHHADWHMCTLAMFRYLSTEGWMGQRWGLKNAMVDVLGWDEPNTKKLDAWLTENKLKKGDMWQAPVDILGHYCCLDVGATFHLYEVLDKFRLRFPALFSFHADEFMTLAKLHIEQQMNGIKINRLKLIRYQTKLTLKMDTLNEEFCTHEDVAPHIETFNQSQINKWRDKEPPRFNQDGETVSKRWEGWKAKEEYMLTTRHFNLNSKKQLGWLLFDCMGMESDKFTKTGQPVVDKKVLKKLGGLAKLVVSYNEALKELGYIKAVLTLSGRDGLLHPSIRVCSTVTGRCSGGLNG